LESLILAMSFSWDGLLSILMVALGLGMVIFFHELGHFAVAKWCDVQVERFSIGFGPILWSRQWGETEYALSAIPFGGYVKMLGQDDMDPGQETSGEVAENPRSYTAKSVPQRMAIISAGVIMNVITGFLFYVAALRMGTQVQGNEVGFVQPGMPAWKAGIREDDTLTSINGRAVVDFSDVTRGTALTTGDIRIVGQHRDGTTYDVMVRPDVSGTKRMIGVGPQSSTKLPPAIGAEGIPLTRPGTPAATVADELRHGDIIKGVGDAPVEGFPDLRGTLTARRGEELALKLARPASDEAAPSMVEVKLPPQPLHTIGVQMKIGPIAAIENGSPAAGAGMQERDRINAVQAPDDEAAREVGKDIDPADLPDWFADHAGQAVKVTFDREAEGASESKTVELTPLDRRNWAGEYGESVPLPIPAIGVAFHFIPTIYAVAPDSPAAKEQLKPGDRVKLVEFLKPADWPEFLGSADVKVEVGEKGWAQVLWLMQTRPTWKIRLTVQPGGGQTERTVTLVSEPSADQFVASDRGLLLLTLLKERKAEDLQQAFAMGWDQTRDALMDIYLTLRGLFSGNISAKELHGPIGIFSIGMKVASNGLPEFLIFLGFLSVNLAVLNFLPIPVLDGGHMVFLLWEGIARRRPSERVYATAMYLGMFFVLGLMVFVIYLDISRRWG
jgi:regulator of sigma E protease